jgi:hypothetical protein
MDRIWDHGLLNLAVSAPISRWGQPSLRNLWARARRRLQLNWAIYGFSPTSAGALQRLLKARNDDYGTSLARDKPLSTTPGYTG